MVYNDNNKKNKNMEKIIRYAFLSVMLLGFACTDEIDTVYESGDRVYFEYEYQDPFYALTRMIKRDSLVVSLGKLPDEQTRFDLKIPVKLLGQPLVSPKTYKVQVIEKGDIVTGFASAVENVHYLPISENQTFRANEWTDTLHVTLLRRSLSANFSKKEHKTLLLKLVETDELKLGLRDGWELKISVNNYISQPSWWNPYALGYYHPEKYKILLMFESEEFYATVNIMNNATRYISALRSYLADNVIIDEETGKRVGFDSLIDL
ncbi:hypothetical protein FACS1894177_04460 [Bacteroidia bacterium]|nr:hypothetical protein FACS1894177_04460 [Bacteroidia bacterium]